MMILPLADTLQNCLQNLTSRIAGVDNEQMTNRVMGMGVGAVKEQFKTPSKNSKTDNSSSNDNTNGGLKGFVSRAKSVINPSGINLSAEKDYNGNTNLIRDNIKTANNKQNNDTQNLKKSANTILKVKSVTGRSC